MFFFLYGDSHVDRNFINIPYPSANYHYPSITMFRVGRDQEIPRFDPNSVGLENSFIFCHGEVDCRCHIKKQVLLGRELDEICESLVNNYIAAIKKNITAYKHIVICFIVPPIRREDYEKKYNHYPFEGSDEERIMYTNKINHLLKVAAEKEGFLFLDCTEEYKSEDGTLRQELSDGNVHIAHNRYILDKLVKLIGQ